MKSSRRPFPLFAFSSLLLCLAAPLSGQPSGGPYGPTQQQFGLPEAERIAYVAPDGDSKATGDAPDQPTSLEVAIANATTGDAILLRGGVYRVGGLRLSQGITLQPYNDERPILKGTKVASNWQSQSNGRWQTTWTRLFPAQPADWWRKERNVEQTPLYLFNNDMVFLNGKLLNAVGKVEDVTADSYHIDYEKALVTIGTDPTHEMVEITAHNSALVRTMRSAHGKSNDGKGPTIRGITFTQYARLALEVEGVEPGAYMDPSNFGKEVAGTTLEHLVISYCSRVAGYFRGDGLIIRNCLISDTGTEGLYVINSANVLLEKNIVTRTNSAEQLTGYYASAVKIFNQSYNVTCRDNLIIDNPHASGIWYDVGNVDGVIVNNWIENTNDGFFFEISKGATCAGNVFVNCEPGVRVLNSAETSVYQNTFFNSPASFERTARSSAAGDHFGWHASAGPDVEERHSHRFANNLLVADEQFEGPLLRFFQTSDLRERLRDPQVQALDGNVYVRQANAAQQPLVFWSPVPEEPGFARFSDLSALRERHPELEESGRHFPSYWGPLFRSARVRNFELMPGFPALDAGIKLPSEVARVLQWSDATPSFPGAYPPRP